MIDYIFNKNKYIKLSENKDKTINIKLTAYKKERIISEPIKLNENENYLVDLEFYNINGIHCDIKICSLNEDEIYDYCIKSEKIINYKRQITNETEKIIYIKINIRKGKQDNTIILKKFKIDKISNFMKLIKTISIVNSKDTNKKKSITLVNKNYNEENNYKTSDMNINFLEGKTYKIKSTGHSKSITSTGISSEIIFSEKIEIEEKVKYSLEFELYNRTSRRIRILLYDSKKKTILDQYILNKVKLKKIILIHSDIKNHFYISLKPVKFNRGDIIYLKYIKLTKVNKLESMNNYDNIIKIPKIHDIHLESSINKNSIRKKIKTNSIIRKIPKNISRELTKLDNIKIDSTTVQIIYPIQANRIYFMRTMLLPKKKDIMYIIDEECREFINNNNIFRDYTDRIIFVTNYDQIRITLRNIKVENIILTVSPHKTVGANLKDYINNIYYIHHGIIFDERVSPLIKAKWDSRMNYMVANFKGKYILKNASIPKENIGLINGLPQFDYILENEKHLNNYKENFKKTYSINENTKIILLVNGSANIKYYRDDTFLTMIIDLLNTLENFDYFLIIKNKYKTSYNFYQENIIELTEIDMIYNYFFSDIIIIVEGGTSLMEALFTTYHKMIFIDWYERTNDLFQTDSLDLIRADNCKELQEIIEDIGNGDRDKNELLKKEVDKYMYDVLNYNSIQFVSDKIIEIVSDKTNSDIYKYIE